MTWTTCDTFFPLDVLDVQGCLGPPADRGVPVVLPFLSGVDPKAMTFVEGDPLETILPWFEQTLARVTA